MDKGKLETSCAPMAIIKRVLWKIGAVWPLCILICYIIQSMLCLKPNSWSETTYYRIFQWENKICLCYVF